MAYKRSILYDNIEAERARKKMTIAECAKQLGIGEKTYRNRIKKNTDLTSSELLKYVKLFGCSADYLLGLTDKINIPSDTETKSA